ncbi:MAG TPA: CGNR zinc finger domain-containing protein [Mycobacteriales bacterium]|nr:CGNR zinc finger domain-containing protein [Mycobacteriales bacterium]
MTVEPTSAPLLGEPLPIELMNTIWADRTGVHDALATRPEVLAWLRAVGPRLEMRAPRVAGWLNATRPSAMAETATELRRLRDALRALTAVRVADPRPDAVSLVADRHTAVEVLNRVAAMSPSWPGLDWQDRAEPIRTARFAGPAGPAIASLLAAEFCELVGEGNRPQLRACLAPGCVLYFAKVHHRREWCSTACGNRARAARHYRRRAAHSQ